MNTRMVIFEVIRDGWKIQFDVELTEEELTKCNMSPLKYVGDYEIRRDNNIISFKCLFDRGELSKDETIEKRLELIKIDIENLAESCIE